MRRNFAMLLTVLLISASIPSIPAYAADDCGFGLERDLGENDMDGTGNYTLPDGTKATLQQGFLMSYTSYQMDHWWNMVSGVNVR